MSEYLLKLRGLKTGIIQKEEKPKPEPIAPRSEKMIEAFKGYKKQVKAFLSRPENLRCKIKMACNGAVAECVHHVAGRTGDKLKDESDWMPACQKCNLWVEENDAAAREKGLKKTRLGKSKKSVQ